MNIEIIYLYYFAILRRKSCKKKDYIINKRNPDGTYKQKHSVVVLSCCSWKILWKIKIKEMLIVLK